MREQRQDRKFMKKTIIYEKYHDYAISSFVLAIFGLGLFWLSHFSIILIPFFIPALVLAHIVYQKSKHNPSATKGRPWSLAAMAIGYPSIIIFLFNAKDSPYFLPVAISTSLISFVLACILYIVSKYIHCFSKVRLSFFAISIIAGPLTVIFVLLLITSQRFFLRETYELQKVLNSADRIEVSQPRDCAYLPDINGPNIVYIETEQKVIKEFANNMSVRPLIDPISSCMFNGFFFYCQDKLICVLGVDHGAGIKAFKPDTDIGLPLSPQSKRYIHIWSKKHGIKIVY